MIFKALAIVNLFSGVVNMALGNYGIGLFNFAVAALLIWNIKE